MASFWDVVKGIVNPVGTIVSAGIGAITGSNNVKNTNNANKQLQIQQQNFQKQWYNENNEYNSPLQQRLRQEAAGLNPNFTDGIQTFQSNTPNLSSPPQMQAYDPANSFNTMAQGLMQLGLQKAQIRNLNADADKKDAEAKNTLTLGKYLSQREQGVIDLQNSQIACNLASAEESKTRAEYNVRSLNVLDGQCKEISERIDLIRAQVLNFNEQTKQKQIENAFAPLFNKSNLQKLSSEIGLNFETTKNIAAQTVKSIVEGKLLNLQYFIEDAVMPYTIDIKQNEDAKIRATIHNINAQSRSEEERNKEIRQHRKLLEKQRVQVQTNTWVDSISKGIQCVNTIVGWFKPAPTPTYNFY